MLGNAKTCHYHFYFPETDIVSQFLFYGPVEVPSKSFTADSINTNFSRLTSS